MVLFAVLGFCILDSSHSHAQERTKSQLTYNRDIRPLLADNCFACHGADSASREADLRLDVREEAVDSGSIVPGKPDESELLARLITSDPDEVMPPPETKKSLTKDEIQRIRRWIAEGAVYQKHWSFIPPQRPEPPTPRNGSWGKNPIDRFILAKLEEVGLSPAPEADSPALFRRLHLDITGLPPDPVEVNQFVAEYKGDKRDEVFSAWIDKLMNRPEYGEHRARYWLDAARYGDTHGLHFDNYREMWPYRDWVIRAFNANQPFDQFTIEQLAGDLLPNPTIDQRVATGFQRCNITTNEGGTIDEENLALYAADRVQTFGWVYLGLTTNCGQCHDHKFDPFTMEDYYSLAAYFRNTTQPAKDGNRKDGRGPVLRVPSMKDRKRWESIPGEIAAAKSRQLVRKKEARKDFESWLTKANSGKPEPHLAADHLIAHFPLNEGAGNEINNLCESAETARATGKIDWSPDGKFGPVPVLKPGKTFELGQLGDFEKNNPFSFGAWIRPGRAGVYGGMIARMDEKSAYRGWDLWQNDLAVAVHIIDAWPNNGIKVVTRNNVLDPRKWKHVFATYDGSGTAAGIRIYVDGKLQPTRVERDSLKPDATIRTNTPLRLGQRSHTQVFDGGRLQDVRVYDRLLRDQEVADLAKSVPLHSLLGIPPNKRTPKQKAALYEYYLTTYDKTYRDLTTTISRLESERQQIEARSPITHIQEERKDSPPEAYILMRGAYDKPGKKVTASTPKALHPLPQNAPQNRLGLALWVVDRNNPLTARVTVNRFWQEIFGRGIVATPEDFGTMGSPPTHPELLDWLAVEFQDSGWDVKHMFKLMLMSATYRQAHIVTAKKLEKDRDNVLLSRGPRFRMDAEMVRDYALASSGLLTRKLYGPPVKPYQPSDIWNMVGLPGGDTRKYVQDTGENLYRRSIYSFWKRMSPPPNLETFNAPSREVCTVRRERTNTPLQALVTLNDPQFFEAARFLAQSAIGAKRSDAECLDFIALRVLARRMEKVEKAILLKNLNQFLDYYRQHSDQAKQVISVGESKPDPDLEPVRLAAWTLVCNQILNLDEVLNK